VGVCHEGTTTEQRSGERQLITVRQAFMKQNENFVNKLNVHFKHLGVPFTSTGAHLSHPLRRHSLWALSERLVNI
jgi:hypothetical protein